MAGDTDMFQGIFALLGAEIGQIWSKISKKIRRNDQFPNWVTQEMIASDMKL